MPYPVQAGPSHNFGATTETVEVLKGPASVLYGIQDPGGIINVITKKPQKESKHVIGGTVGNNSMWGTQLDSTGGLGYGFSYRFIYDKQEKDYWRNFGEVKSTTYAPSLAWENDKTKILLAYEHLDYTQPFDRGTQLVNGSVVNIPAERRLDEPNNQTTGKTDNIQVKIEQKLNDQWKLNFTYGYARDKYNYRQTRVVAVNTDYTNTLSYRSGNTTRTLDPRTALRRLEKQAADANKSIEEHIKDVREANAQTARKVPNQSDAAEKTAENPTALSPAEQAELAELDDELAHYIEQYHPAEDAPPVQPKQNS